MADANDCLFTVTEMVISSSNIDRLVVGRPGNETISTIRQASMGMRLGTSGEAWEWTM